MCTENWTVRIEKESQRYQGLKAHTEKKLTLAKEDVTQVWSKAQNEAMALQVSLEEGADAHLLSEEE